MRDLTWGRVPNLRDLGGLDGRFGTTQFGRVARGPRRERLDEIGWRRARTWGVRTVVDLRCPEEVGRRDGDPQVGPEAWEGVRIVSAPMEDHSNAEFREICFPILDSPEVWTHTLRIFPDLIAAALDAIATAEPGVLVHCSAGRDRTGLITALLLANAGVPGSLIAADYERSVRAMAGKPSHSPTYDVQTTWNAQQTDAWVARTRPLVTAFADAAPQHLVDVGVDEATRDRLRDLLLAKAF